ncbi:MAG: patatin-like phospholipase family protein [Bacteroidota bacterium]
MSEINVPVNPKLVLIEKARKVLRGERNLSSKQLKELYLELEKHDQFAYATEVLLAKMRLDEDGGEMISLKEYHKLTNYIYKDHSLPSSFKFEKALLELKANDDLYNTDICESLGLAGALYKRKWLFDHQFKNLVLSRFYYKRGFELWKSYLGLGDDASMFRQRNDDGYTAINYAYISELMAVDKIESYGRTTGLTEDINELFGEAVQTRRFILEHFTENVTAANPVIKSKTYPAWVYATVAEAYFGLRNYEAALSFIQQYIRLEGLNAWEIRTFSQQIFSIAYLQMYQKKFRERSDAGQLALETNMKEQVGNIDLEKINTCLAAFMQNGEPGDHEGSWKTEIKKDGKLGLALSGGGFRASLFHIGVLASLADKDELRNIEVISCVSGGSIIGAYYYLKLKILFESKTDEELSKEDYIELVKEVEEGFLKGVQKNLRVSIFSDLASNFRMIFDKHYSRTHRLGELYERHLYRPIWEGAPESALAETVRQNGGHIYMHDLFIKPKLSAGESFNFSTDNWKRKNRIPQLVLNATSVNTGHNWQFTASWMGEPPGNIMADVDVKPRLRRMYYSEAPDRYKKFRLGFAVGASSCVPVMFYPMPLHDLYPDIDLQLIDGGLHDNQGIAALIEQECKNMIISDASGQMPTNAEVTTSSAAVFYRADSILQERLRELQFMDIKERNYTTQLNSLVAVHLKNDLQTNPVSWKFCTDPPRTIMYANLSGSTADLTKYGLLRNVQTLLSEVRTDLDSFNNTEAYALMYSGYQQINYERCRLHNEDAISSETDWDFMQVQDFVTQPDKAVDIQKLLVAAKKIPFKIMDVNPRVRIVAIVFGIVAIIALAVWMYNNWQQTLLNINVAWVGGILIIFMLGFVSKHLATLANLRSTFRKYVGLVLFSLLAFVLSNLYLWLLNPLYNRAGEIPGRNKK